MKTRPLAIVLMILTTLFTSSAQVLYKFSSAKISLSIVALLSNYYLIGGILLYAFGAVLMLLAFKGGDVSILYPIIATSYIWVAIMSWIFFSDVFNIFKYIAIILIVAGVSVIGFASKWGEPTL